MEELAGKHKEDVIDLEDETEKYKMADKNKREARRIIGLNDEETVAGDLTKPKSSFSGVPTEIRDDSSMGTALSGLTNYSTSTAASKERKALRNQVTDQQEELDEQAAEIIRLTKALNTLEKQQKEVTLDTKSEDNTLNDVDLSSGENTSESPEREGWGPDIEFSDEEGKEMVRKKTADTKDSEESTHETDFYDKNGEAISHWKDTDPSIDGLKFLARGSSAEIKNLQKGLSCPSVVSNPFRFEDLGETWVELFEIVNVSKFSKAYSTNSGSKSTSVRFSDQGQVQEFDPGKATLQNPVKEVAFDYNSDSENEYSGEDSNEASGSSGSSKSSSSSPNIIASSPSGTKKKYTRKPTNITSTVLSDAKHIAHISDTTGSGKSFNV